MAKRKEIELSYLHFIQGLRELSEFYIRDKHYDNFDEMISIQVGELMERLASTDYDKKFQTEIDFYLKFSGLDDSDFMVKYESIQLDDDKDDYSASDWIDEKKFYMDFAKEYKLLKKEVVK